MMKLLRASVSAVASAYGNHFWVDPSAKLTVVVLTNTAFAGMLGEFPDAVRRAVYGPAQP
ncbi:hypothetical protein [Sorangium sp. So ce363]|uniref:hypothetical protein n=1 Tax=Sorangium sp. So ce363 TaxID=3133304 RepID=UPI003F5F6902